MFFNCRITVLIVILIQSCSNLCKLLRYVMQHRVQTDMAILALWSRILLGRSLEIIFMWVTTANRHSRLS